MCRFIVYMGHDVRLSDVVLLPEHSMVELGVKLNQNLPSIDRDTPWCSKRNAEINADGYGVGFYQKHGTEPGLLREITAVGNSPNLPTLSRAITTPLVFAHVRAATDSATVTIQNCHPFSIGRWLFMHNGSLAHFKKVQQRIISSLNRDIFCLCEGTSDSWYLFLIFLQHVYELKQSLDFLKSDLTIEEIGLCLKRTLSFIHKIMLESDITAPSSINVAVTDGNNVVATRYRNSAHTEPPSLYYNLGSKYEVNHHQCPGGKWTVNFEKTGKENVALVVSEPLFPSSHWKLVPKNCLLYLKKLDDGSISFSSELLQNIRLSPFIDPLVPSLQRTYKQFLSEYSPPSFENFIKFITTQKMKFPGIQMYRLLCAIAEWDIKIPDENHLSKESCFKLLTCIVRTFNLNLDQNDLELARLKLEPIGEVTSPSKKHFIVSAV